MNCHETQARLVGFLEGDGSTAERALISAHMAGCAACRVELNSLAATRDRVGVELHHMGDPAEAPLQAWERLAARLADEDRRMERPRPGLFEQAGQLLSGAWIMSGRIKIAIGSAAAAALVLVGYFVLNPATPVSAQEIIEKAQAAEAAKSQQKGVLHMRTAFVLNIPQPGDPMTTESYLNIETSQYRDVTRNDQTGNPASVSGFDGTYLYSSDAAAVSTPLTVYKSPAPDGWAKTYDYTPGGQVNEEAIFEQLKQADNVQYLGKEKWVDGRDVYVIRASVDASKLKARGAEVSNAYSVLYFDAKTYQMVETKLGSDENGSEKLISDTKILVDEVLPASTSIAWDLSDLKGIALADDPNGEKTGPWLQSPDKGGAVVVPGIPNYRLSPVPEGFSENIAVSAPGAQEKLFMAQYRNDAGDYLVIESPANVPDSVMQQMTQTYHTASGLTLHLQGSDTPPTGMDKPDWMAVVDTPEGTFTLTSNLPLATVEQLAETLMGTKK